LDEFSLETIECVLDLINQGSLYRGEEYRSNVFDFFALKKSFDKLPNDEKVLFTWECLGKVAPSVMKIRNTAIGTLLIDIQNSVDLDEAVRKYEAVVAPANYKRSKPIFTQKMLEDAQKKADEDKAERQKQADKLKDSIMKDKTLMGDMEINQDVRKKIFENVFKPVYKDPETGEYLTAIQKYETEHRSDFLKYVSLFFTMTNGFKDFDSLTKGKVKKEVRKGLSELEKTLNGTKRNSDGSLKMVTSVTDDPESFITKGFKLDI
jgi:hypothetical protein